MTYKIGQQIWFWDDDAQPYIIQAAGPRFLVCTFPHEDTVMYTIVDLVNYVRGTENLIFGAGAETPQLCAEMQDRLETGETEISRRNVVLLQIKEPA